MSIVDDGKPRRRHLHDETVVVFRAATPRAARAHALRMARAAEHEYTNLREERVRWVFVALEALTEIGPRVDGIEVSSRLFERDAPAPVPFPAKRLRQARSSRATRRTP